MKLRSTPTSHLLLASLLLLGACAQLPPAVKELGWKDQWGDRGEPVLARDYAMCQELVEQRRSLLSSCMAHRGWAWAEPE
jgi:hypothetical protein